MCKSDVGSGNGGGVAVVPSRQLVEVALPADTQRRDAPGLQHAAFVALWGPLWAPAFVGIVLTPAYPRPRSARRWVVRAAFVDAFQSEGGDGWGRWWCGWRRR